MEIRNKNNNVELQKNNSIPLLSKTLITTNFTVGSTATRIINPTFKKEYIITNCARTGGLRKRHGLATITTAISITTTPTDESIIVSGFSEAHVIMSVTAVTGTWDIYAITKGSTSYYARTQKLYNGIASTGGYYGFLNKEGLAEILAFEFVEVSAGSITVDTEIILKDGKGRNTGYTTNDTDNIVYVGLSNDVTVSSGHPILPNNKLHFMLEDDSELWAISNGMNVNTGTLEGITVKLTSL